MEITQQALFYGVVSGLIYAILAAGFVLVYRCTGVLNFAQGEIGAFGVAVFTLFNAGYGIPYWLSFGLAVGISALIGAVIELTVVRRLFHSPRLVLLIATIGLAPLVVQELLGVVEALKAQGQTMIIVEQSLNVALAFADRAIFMEKGRIRFEGPARELLERDDLVRAVFLGGEGG